MTLLDLVLRNEDYNPGTVLNVYFNGKDKGTISVNDLICIYSHCEILSFGRNRISLAGRRNE